MFSKAVDCWVRKPEVLQASLRSRSIMELNTDRTSERASWTEKKDRYSGWEMHRGLVWETQFVFPRENRNNLEK